MPPAPCIRRLWSLAADSAQRRDLTAPPPNPPPTLPPIGTGWKGLGWAPGLGYSPGGHPGPILVGRRMLRARLLCCLLLAVLQQGKGLRGGGGREGAGGLPMGTLPPFCPPSWSGRAGGHLPDPFWHLPVGDAVGLARARSPLLVGAGGGGSLCQDPPPKSSVCPQPCSLTSHFSWLQGAGTHSTEPPRMKVRL